MAVVWSRVVPETCYEVIHCWNPSCLTVCFETWWNGLKVSLKLYFILQKSDSDLIKNHVRKEQTNDGKPVVMLKSHDEAKPKPVSNNHSTSQPNISNMLANDNMPSHVYKEKSRSVVVEGICVS